MTEAIEIRTMRAADLPAVAEVHSLAFEGFFLDQMGKAFLRQYYATILAFPDGLSLVAVRPSGEIVGFAAGFLGPEAFYAYFRSRRLRFVPAMMAAVCRRPSLLKRILSNARRVSAASDTEEGIGELASIGVGVRGGGIGSMLLDAFCERMFQMGAVKVALSTDARDNDATRGFYVDRGFLERGEEQRGDRLLCHYELPRRLWRPT